MNIQPAEDTKTKAIKSAGHKTCKGSHEPGEDTKTTTGLFNKELRDDAILFLCCASNKKYLNS